MNLKEKVISDDRCLTPFQSLVKGSQMEIIDFEGAAQMVERLKEMGISRGKILIYCGRAPFQGPLLFRMNAITLALRQEEAQCLYYRILAAT